MRPSLISARPETGQTAAARSKHPWVTALAGLLLLVAAMALMAYSAPAHAQTRPHTQTRPHSQSRPAQTRPRTQAVPLTKPGTLVSATLLQRLSAASVRSELAAARLAPGAPSLGAGAVRYGVVAYRVTYRTVNAAGQPVLASGLVAFPSTAKGTRTLPVVSYDHGTTATSADTPSSFGLGPDHAVEGRWSAELFASAGFAVTEPDYVGMGSGTGPVEYLVAKSEATASADLLLAARTLAGQRHDTLERGVLVTGFSQGGGAAMALGRDLQQDEQQDSQQGKQYFRLRALAPVSGPYNLISAELPGLFNGQVASAVAPYYIGYTLTTWNALYHLYGTPADAFLAPYANEISGLFDGSHQDAAIAAALPDSLNKLLTPQVLGQLKNPQGRFMRAFQANQTCTGWTPQVPVRLYAASGDTTVTQVNAQQCARAIQARGGSVQLIQLGQVDHDTSDFVALPQIVRWFSELSGLGQN
jgi:hypothetical protein